MMQKWEYERQRKREILEYRLNVDFNDGRMLACLNFKFYSKFNGARGDRANKHKMMMRKWRRKGLRKLATVLMCASGRRIGHSGDQEGESLSLSL